jgi:hypothetical protein
VNDEKPWVTLVALLYGDYPQLAERCLTPLSRLSKSGIPILIGANEISEATADVVKSLDLEITVKASPQIYKYPMMRKLLRSVKTDYVMWFDDDSWITDDMPETWLKIVELRMRSEEADALGSKYGQNLTDRQLEWIKTRKWYREKPLNRRAMFLQGGWWVARMSMLKELDWPDKDIRHRGGDVMMGVAMVQNDKVVLQYRQGVAINADSNGQESASKRRGYNEPPVGA